MFNYGFNMFSVMEMLFPIIFIVVLGFIIVIMVRGIKQWSYNNAQPKIPAEALVVAKRTAVSHYNHNAGTADVPNMIMTTDTTYYVTFEFDSGDRLEFHVPAREYGLIAEGDSGVLTSQGTRFISFERHR